MSNARQRRLRQPARLVIATAPAARYSFSSRLKHWLRRYLPAEIAGTAFALVGGLSASWLGSALPVMAYAAALSENIGYYATMLAIEWRTQRARHLAEHKPGLHSLKVTFRNLVLEFGPAELLDSLLLRPASILACSALLGSAGPGIVTGKLLADALFYVPVIVSYELRARRG